MEAAAAPGRPRVVTLVGWVWLVLGAVRSVESLVGLLIWKIGGIERMPSLRFRMEGMRVRILGLEILMQHAVAIMLAQIVVGVAVAWAAFQLLKMKPWARKAIQAAAAFGILLSLAIAVYVYSATASMAGLEGVDADEVRTAGMAAAGLVALLGSTFFGLTIWLLGQPAVRRAFERPS